MIFDVKMNFTQKVRFVATISTTDTPVELCYLSIIPRESVRLACLAAALNDLDVFICDTGNTYVNAQCKANIWSEANIDRGKEALGEVMRLVWVVYGLKTRRTLWR